MKTKSIKIEVPEGCVPVWNDEKTVLTFNAVPKNVRDNINGWEDILKYHNKTAEQFDSWCTGLEPHEVATRQVEMIAATYNQGEKADYNNDDPKGYPVYDASGGGFRFFGADLWPSCSSVGSRLLFVGPEWRENVIDAAEKFKSIYKIHLLS